MNDSQSTPDPASNEPNEPTREQKQPAIDAGPGVSSLREALQLWDVALDEKFHEPVENYCKVLWDWNTRLNLTRHDTYEKFVARDLVDTIELAKLIPEGKRVLDVGTGGGVPGMVLSIIRPDLDVTLCDSVTKKAKAVAGIATELNLPVSVAHARAEELLDMTSYDVLTARAVGSLARILTWFEESWDSIGTLLLIKGPKWVEERGEARHQSKLNKLELRKLAEYPIPGCDWNSVILRVEPKDA